MRTAAFSSIGLDDAAYTFRNPFVAGGLSLPNVVEAFTNLRHSGIWMPLTYLSYMADASFCRMTGIPLIGWMHVVNVLLHVANFLFLWKFLSVLHDSAGESPPPSPQNSNTQTLKHSNTQSPSSSIFLLAALVWAVHPLRAEPVAWIAARKELLWTLFTLSGLLCWIKCLTPLRNLSTQTLKHSNTQTLKHSASHLLTIIFCALACLSKPTAMCFPLLVLLVAWRLGYFVKPHRNAENPLYNPSLFTFHHSSFLTFRLLPLFLIAALTGAIAAYSQTHVAGQDAVALYAAPLAHRLVNALSAIGFYLRATFWPFGLHVDCRAVPGLWPLDAGWNLAALGIALASLGLWVLFLTPRRRAHTPQRLNLSTSQLLNPSNTFFALAWFLIALLPTLGLFGSFGIEAHADRFTYLPSMAFSFLIAWLFAGRYALADKPNVATGDRHPGNPPLKPFNHLTFNLLTIITFLLSVLTFIQLGFWRDDATAHRRALACDPEHPRALVHVADARCSRHHDFDGGIRLYRQALARADTVPPGGFNAADVKAKLAYALATRGWREDFAEVKRLGAAILREPWQDRRGLMLDALGTAFLHEGKLERAASLFQTSLDAPDRFWPKASTRHKLDSCRTQ